MCDCVCAHPEHMWVCVHGVHTLHLEQLFTVEVCHVRRRMMARAAHDTVEHFGALHARITELQLHVTHVHNARILHVHNPLCTLCVVVGATNFDDLRVEFYVFEEVVVFGIRSEVFQ